MKSGESRGESGKQKSISQQCAAATSKKRDKAAMTGIG